MGGWIVGRYFQLGWGGGAQLDVWKGVLCQNWRFGS